MSLSTEKRSVLIIKLFFVCLAAAALTFFFSVLAGVDFSKDSETLEKFSVLRSEITHQLDGGINRRILSLGLAPATEPHKEFYCVGLARELIDLYYLASKPRIVLGTHDEVEFRRNSVRILGYARNSQLTSLIDEIIPLTGELQDAVSLIDRTEDKITRIRLAYIVLFFGLVIVLYIIAFYRYRIRSYFIDRRSGYERRRKGERRKEDSPIYSGQLERRRGADRRTGTERRNQGERRRTD